MKYNLNKIFLILSFLICSNSFGFKLFLTSKQFDENDDIIRQIGLSKNTPVQIEVNESHKLIEVLEGIRKQLNISAEIDISIFIVRSKNKFLPLILKDQTDQRTLKDFGITSTASGKLIVCYSPKKS